MKKHCVFFCCFSIVAFLITLAGPHAAAQATLGPVNVGASATTPVTVTVTTAGALGSISVRTMGAEGLDFTNAGGGTCAVGASYAVAATCTVNVNFSPILTGTRYGAVELLDGSGSTLATAYLEGTGAGPQTTFLPGVTSPIASGLGTEIGDYIAVDGSGNVYILDYDNHTLYKEALAGGKYAQTTIDGSFAYPSGVAVDGTGSVYVTDQGYGAVFRETPANGQYTKTEILSGFSAPCGVAVDAGGNVYVEDAGNKAVFKETLANGSYTQSTVVSGLVNPQTLAVDGTGNIYLTDEGNSNLYKETLSNGQYTQTTIGSGFLSVAVDGNGGLYAAKALFGSTNSVYKLTQSGGQYTESAIGGNLCFATSMAVDGAGNVYAADRGCDDIGTIYPIAVYKIDLAAPPSLDFASTAPGSTSSDSPRTVTVANIGNAPLEITSVAYPKDFPEAPGISGECADGQTVAAGGFCAVTVLFSPTSPLNGERSQTLSETVKLVSNSLNGSPTEQNIPVTGTETNSPAITLTSSPNPSLAGSAVTFTAKVSATSGTPTGTVAFMNGNSRFGSATLSSGTATYSTSAFTAGSYSITAVYSGDADFSAATSSALTQTVNAPAPDFKISVTPASVTVKPGATAAFTYTVTPINGFNAMVSPGCSGLPSEAQCVFNPGTVSVNSGPATSAFTVTTTPPAVSANRATELPWNHDRNRIAFAGISLGLFAIFLIPRRYRGRAAWLPAALLFLATFGLTGCGAIKSLINQNTDPGTPAGTYTITVTGGSLNSDGTVNTHSTAITLVVQ